MAGQRLSRLLALLAAAALALAIVASAFAHASPSLPHAFGASAAADTAGAEDTTAPDRLQLPVAGSGGLADGGGSLPVMALIFTISMLAGVAGVMAVRRLRA